MALSDVTEAVIRERSSADSFQRGQEYYQQGMVEDLVQRGDVLQAEVEGSAPEPYVVLVTLDEDGVAEARCACPYDWGGWCKHIVATLLAALHTPRAIEQRPPLRDLLAGVDRDGLQTLLLTLVDREPHLGDLLEGDIALLTPAPATETAPSVAQSPRRASVDTKAIRRQVRAIHRGRGGSLFELLEQAEAFLTAGDGPNALALLDALTDETVAEESFESWEGRDDWEDEPTGFFEELGPVWAEALLSTELTATERAAWADKLEAWQENPAQYGYDEVFDVAIEAAQQGWDDPALRRVLRGQSMEPISRPREVPAWGAGAGDGDGDLTAIRMAILERQGRHEEYLHLAAAAGRVAAYAAMLVQLRRVREAVDYGLIHLASPDDALTLAQALRAHDELPNARRIAAHGMTLPGRKGALAPWLRDLALAMGDSQQALDAAVIAFKEEPGLPLYLQARELDKEDWSARRDELLEILRTMPRTYYPEGPVDIFLHEGLIDDAIAAVDHGVTHTLVERVVEAAIATHPDWVIKTARGQAEPFMDEGKAQYYGVAARWLAHARDAYRAAGREAEWRAYHQELVAVHGRKYKLVPLLQRLR